MRGTLSFSSSSSSFLMDIWCLFLLLLLFLLSPLFSCLAVHSPCACECDEEHWCYMHSKKATSSPSDQTDYIHKYISRCLLAHGDFFLPLSLPTKWTMTTTQAKNSEHLCRSCSSGCSSQKSSRQSEREKKTWNCTLHVIWSSEQNALSRFALANSSLRFSLSLSLSLRSQSEEKYFHPFTCTQERGRKKRERERE